MEDSNSTKKDKQTKPEQTNKQLQKNPTAIQRKDHSFKG